MRRALLSAAAIVSVMAVPSAAPALAGQAGSAAEPRHSLAELRKRYTLPESRFGTFGGVPAHYTDQGEGPVLLLLHGSFLDLTAWDSWIAEFAPTHRVIRLDRLRFGLTGHTGGGAIDYADEHAFVSAFVEKLDLKGVTIVGSSSGGLVAARYAADHPERVERAILVNFPLGHDRISSATGGKAPPPGSRKESMRYTVERNLVDKSIATNALIDRLTDFALREDPGNSAAGAWKQAASLTEADRRAILGRIKVPTLVIWSEENRTLPVEAGKAALDAVGATQKQFLLVKNAGHMFPLERGADVAVAVRPFLEGRTLPATLP